MEYLRRKMVKKNSAIDDYENGGDEEVNAGDAMDVSGEEASDEVRDLELDEEPETSDSSDSDVEDDDEEKRKEERVNPLFVPDIADSGRLFIRNLPFDCIESELRELFEKYGQVEELHIPQSERNAKERSGIAFATFSIPADALRAQEELDGTIFQGRLLHILAAKPSRQSLRASLPQDSKHLSDFQKKKQQEQALNAAKKSEQWNPLFIRADAVAEMLAEKFDVTKAHLMDPENQNLALRQALGEAAIVNETKKHLTEHGVSVVALEGLYNAKTAPKRSDRVILVKNIPYATEAAELLALFGQHGKLGRIVLPPTKTMAMVEFFNATDAKIAFQRLAFRAFHDAPLFLEWAPLDVWAEGHEEPPKPAAEEIAAAGAPARTPEEILRHEEAENAQGRNTANTLFVKNLSFETTENSLQQFFRGTGEVRNVTIAKKRDMKNKGKILSMGYGFVEFKTRDDALSAFRLKQGQLLDGHEVQLQLSKQAETTKAAKRRSTAKKGQSTKLMVKNVPFQANKKEIRELFAAYGELKSVRLPLKQGGKAHRGFAFVEFLTKEEAAAAMEALSNTHLYGRHLVIDYGADKDGESDEEI